jgi:glycerol-3-phosphate acyltransferase PlsY
MLESPVFSALFFGLLGYLCGSFPFAVWVTRAVKGVDVREAGSRHATATNTFRQAGWAAGALVAALDIGKGFLPTYLALEYAGTPWAASLAAGLAVVGHCWPLFAQFRGGMGLATAGGCILAVSPLGFFIGVGVLVTSVLLIHHSARASVVTGLIIPPVLVLLGQRGMVIWVSIAVGIVISIRFLRDWRRQYRELWLDREG